jgi:hypothetical protein
VTAYELDDDLVRSMIQFGRNCVDGTAPQMMSVALETQLPIPVPTGYLAVVENERTAVFIHSDPPSSQPWLNVVQRTWHSTEGLGRIAKVHYEGQD